MQFLLQSDQPYFTHSASSIKVERDRERKQIICENNRSVSHDIKSDEVELLCEAGCLKISKN